MDKIVSIESLGGPEHAVLLSVMRMVPERDQSDVALQRLLAFRLRIDGESSTREYLMRKIRDMIQCRYSGRLYDFIKDDQESRHCSITSNNLDPDPPESA